MSRIPVTIKGGEKLKIALMRLGGKTPLLRVGILEGATYSGEPKTREKPGQSVATVAFWQEYGTRRNTPPRPFMRNTVAEYKHSWAATLGTLIMTRSSFAEAFDALGFAMIPDFRNTIIKGVSPPSAPSTIAFKKRIGKEYANTPLILTRTMLASIAYEVIE